MVDELPRPTPEGKLIRGVRDRFIPKLTIRAAAARIGLSAEQWGYIERGYYPGRSGNPPRAFSAPATTLAKMARALRIPPERLESEGQRPDAAEVLRAIIQEQADSGDSFKHTLPATEAPSDRDVEAYLKIVNIEREAELPPQTEREAELFALPYISEEEKRMFVAIMRWHMNRSNRSS